MLYRRTGMPQEDEIVLCTITNVQHHSVFAKLDEYDKSGMIHISEVSPGRIRNIRDYVQEGKKVVCKVLRIDEQKGHIDLSLRRVNEGQKRKKQEEIKHEQKAEKIIELLAKKSKKDFKKLYDEISEKVFAKYDYIYESFNDIVEETVKFEKLGFEKKLGAEIERVVKDKIKPAEVTIKGELHLMSYEPDGIEMVKEALKKAKGAEIKYKGAGVYNVVVKAPDYKEAEKILGKATEVVIKHIEKNKGKGSFERSE